MIDRKLGRRRYLSGMLAGLASATAGCGRQQTAPGDSPTEVSQPACADGLRIVEKTARIEAGTVPEVHLRLENPGDDPVTYEIRNTMTYRLEASLRCPAERQTG